MEILNQSNTLISVHQHHILSAYLEKEFVFDVYFPVKGVKADETTLLLLNDGQDLPKMPFIDILGNLLADNRLEPLLCVGIYCTPQRTAEYGTAYRADYKGRGAQAGCYTKFVMDELIPFIKSFYQMPSFKENAFAGFSLGALSAFDIVWNNATEFSKVGVFSGSLWWRRKAYKNGYNDQTDRIMHTQVQQGGQYPWLKLFFEVGTLDETKDRNNNGVIDVIDDSYDMLKILYSKGYNEDHVKLLILEKGRHDVPTWAKALPIFLEWGWKTQSL